MHQSQINEISMQSNIERKFTRGVSKLYDKSTYETMFKLSLQNIDHRGIFGDESHFNVEDIENEQIYSYLSKL